MRIPDSPSCGAHQHTFPLSSLACQLLLLILLYRISSTCIQVIQSESESRSVMSDSLQPMDYTAHGLLQARILEWVVIPSSRDQSLPTRGLNPGLPHCGWILYQLSLGSPRRAGGSVQITCFVLYGPCFLRFPRLPPSLSGASVTIL